MCSLPRTKQKRSIVVHKCFKSGASMTVERLVFALLERFQEPYSPLGSLLCSVLKTRKGDQRWKQKELTIRLLM